MNKNLRIDHRFSVSLYVERQDLVDSPILIQNLSENGFLVRGPILASPGSTFRATFRVHPKAGEMRVTVLGKVMHCRVESSDCDLGIKIMEFASLAEQKAYITYVNELKAGVRRTETEHSS